MIENFDISHAESNRLEDQLMLQKLSNSLAAEIDICKKKKIDICERKRGRDVRPSSQESSITYGRQGGHFRSKFLCA